MWTTVRDRLNRLLRFSDSLLWWQLRQLLPVNLLALAVTVPYVLLRDEPFLLPGDWAIMLAVVVHCAAIVITLGRLTTRSAVFLYSQGFTRDQIWNSKLIASACSALVVCGGSWLLIAMPIRSLVQDQFCAHPFYPMIAADELWLPWALIVVYATVLLAMHYVWIRAAQATRGGESGWMLMVLCLGLLAFSYDRVVGMTDQPTALLTVVALQLPAVVLLSLACRHLHRQAEVRG